MSGFLGPPDDRMAALQTATLAHRGGDQVERQRGSRATICLRLPRLEACLGPIPPRLHRDPDLDLELAFCGWLTGIDDRELAASAAEADPNHFFHCFARRFRDDRTSTIEKLRGAFVMAVRDGDELHLARDGAGNRTVFYAWHGGRWLFGIEPKAITAVPGFPKRVRPAALAQYLACSFVPGSGTMLEGLFELEAGHLVTLRADEPPHVQRWFRFEAACTGDEETSPDSAGPTDREWVSRFRHEMERAVAERLPRERPIGVFLSGGLDSSLVTAEVARQVGGRNVRTWALHFGKQYSSELEFARAVAERCGTVHREVLIRPRHFLPRLRRMIWHLDDPIGDPITQPNFELAAQVADEVQFIFNGEGGDPCFGGPKNIPMMLHHWYGGLERSQNFRERHYLESYRRAWDELDFLLSDEVRQQIDVERDLESVFRPYLRANPPARFLDRLTALNIREKGAHLIQPKVERMLGAHGITPLAPLFDERIIQLSFEIPARLKLSGGNEKVLLKRAYQDALPAEVIARPKSGMRVPVHYWFRSEMRRYAKRILSRRATLSSGLFNPDRVKQLLAYDIEEGHGRYGLRLWMLITFELWRRIVVEGESV